MLTANPAAGVTTGNTVATRNGAELQFSLPLTYSVNRTLSNQVVGGITTGSGEVATTNKVNIQANRLPARHDVL